MMIYGNVWQSCHTLSWACPLGGSSCDLPRLECRR